jgi:cytochrome P450
MTQTYPATPADPLQAVTHPDPYPYYTALRESPSPLIRHDALNLWIAARAPTVRAVLEDERLTVRPASEPVPRAIAGEAAGHVFGQLARMNEGEPHRLARRALLEGLGSVDTEQVFESARTRAATAIEQSVAQDARVLDALAFALPVQIVAELVGLPTAIGLEATVRHFVACLSPAATADALRDAHRAASQLQLRLQALTQDAASTSPLLERIASAGLERHPALPNALVSNLLGLFSQTFDATAGLIGNSIVTLARIHGVASQLTRSVFDIHGFVREVARFDPAVHNTRRFAREAVCIEGVTLQPGDAILVVLASASRDDALFEQADHFIPARTPPWLPGFGAGRHACPGESIGRAITAGVVGALAESGFDFAHPALRWTYRPSLNGRIPKFAFVETNNA